MTKQHRVLSAFFVAVFALSSALSAAAGSMDAFKTQREYKTGTFKDIKTSDWFYCEVVNAYEYGIANGADETSFLPHDLISLAEVIAFASRIHSIYQSDGAGFAADKDKLWYAPYIEYAVKHDIISDDDFTENLEKPASRAQTAYILANCLPFTEFLNINADIDYLPDVTVNDDYYNEIIMLYRAGVLSGKDEQLTFSPKENVTRAETAATINRIIDKSQRRKISLIPYNSPSAPVQNEHYDAVAVSRLASPAVFYIEIYDKNKRALGSGSGFFIDSDGEAVTNFHVIEEAYYAKIKTVDGDVYDVAEVVGYDKSKDLAIIKVSGKSFPFLELADSEEIKNGQKIFCVGSPLGLENSISEGVVSNALRTINGQTYVQITAPISSGSSGGAVLDTNCRVIGVSSAGIEEGQNINLAIPSNFIGEITRDKNISLYDMQTAGLYQSAQAGQTFFYPDNKSIPDYGFITGYEEIQNSYDDTDKVMMRTYNFSNSAVIRYVQTIQSIGYKVTRQQSTGFTTNMYFEYGGNVLAVYANYMNRTVTILYYNN